MAFVCYDQAIAGGQIADVGAAGQRLQGGDVDGAAQLGPAAAELAGLDRYYDVNTPESTTDGLWTGWGWRTRWPCPAGWGTLTDAFRPRPLLEAYQVAWLGVEPRVAPGWEREQADRLGLHVTTSQALAGAARAVLEFLPAGPLAVHIDVDVLDFIDAPLAENTDCRNTGPTSGEAEAGLQIAARDPRVRALSIGETQPDPMRGRTLMPLYTTIPAIDGWTIRP